MGFIGMGTQGRGLLGNFLRQDTHVVAVCDVDTTRRNDAKKKVDKFYKNSDCAAYDDFRELIARKDIDAVCIATPDHWHAIVTLAALRSGKDVYCEKPLTHNIHEAVEVMKTTHSHKRILQTGSMQRSMKEFRVACELVRNGVIGTIQRVECSFGDPGRPCDLPEETMEPGLDWNMWCGPAPFRGYNSMLSPRGVHEDFPDWRDYKEYGSGAVGDWGAHHLDIAQWGLGMDDSGPVEVIPPDDPNAKRGAKLVYANGVTVEHKDGFGVDFFGTGGEVRVNRGQFVVIVDGKTGWRWRCCVLLRRLVCLAPGRLWRTLKALVFRPGLLTKEYFAGRRARYRARPGRLFLAMSVATFAVIGVLRSPVELQDAVVIRDKGDDASADAKSKALREDAQAATRNGRRIRSAVDRFEDGVQLEVRKRLNRFSDLPPARTGRALIRGRTALRPLHAVCAATGVRFAAADRFAGESRRYPQHRQYAAHLVYGAHLFAFVFLMVLLLVAVLRGYLRASSLASGSPTTQSARVMPCTANMVGGTGA